MRGVGRRRLARARWSWPPRRDATSPPSTSTMACAPGRPPRPGWWRPPPSASGRASRAAPWRWTAGPNLEARARAARFAVLPDGVATGHTMDDQAETILLNLLRGAGADGLAGMEPGLRHPLLGPAPQRDPRRCAAARASRRCATRATHDPAFVRNRVRHELLPLCADVAGRDPVPLLARQAGVLRDEVALLETLAPTAVPDPADARAVARTARASGAPGPAPVAARGERRRTAAVAGRGRAGPRRGAGRGRSGPSSPGGRRVRARRAAASGSSRTAPVVSRR